MPVTDRSHHRCSKARLTPARLLPLMVVVAGFAIVVFSDMNDYLSYEALRDHHETLMAWRTRHYLLVTAGFISVYSLLVALSVPGSVWMTLAGGFLFGTVPATIYVVAAATAGATAIFLAARHAFADYVAARAGPRVRAMEEGFRDNALSYLLVLRLVPIFPFWLVNLASALLGIPFRTFVVGTLVGIIPGSFVYAMLGAGFAGVIAAGQRPDLGILFKPEILGALIGLALLSLVPVLYKRIKRGGKRPQPERRP